METVVDFIWGAPKSLRMVTAAMKLKDPLAGVQPRWIQGDSKVGTELASWKNLFNYRYRGRLETDSVVGELVEKRG